MPPAENLNESAVAMRKNPADNENAAMRRVSETFPQRGSRRSDRDDERTAPAEQMP